MHFCDADLFIHDFVLVSCCQSATVHSTCSSQLTLRVKRNFRAYLVKAEVLFDCIGREENFSVASYDKQKTV